MKQTLNIPLKLMKRHRRDKSMWELFVFAVCIKCLKGSSGLHPDISSVRKLMQCSYNKAKRLIEHAKQCPTLFYYNPEKNFLVARTFTHGKLNKCTYRRNRKEYTAYAAYCYKFEYDVCKAISHNRVSRHLRDQLIVSAIKAKERKNDFLIVVCKNSTRSERSKALSVKRLSRIAGVHHTTVSRHIGAMEKENIIQVKRHDFIKVYDYLSGMQLTNDRSLLRRKPFLREGYLVVKDANEYRSGSAFKSTFTNVIFNHEKRHHSNISKRQQALGHLWL